MDSESLAGSGGRPVRIILGNAVDSLVYDVDEFALRGVIGIQTENLCIRILGPGSCRCTKPAVLSHHGYMHGDCIIVRRTSEVGNKSGDLVVFRQLVPV